MDDTLQAARAAFQQRLQDLATQFRQNHTAWQEAVRVHDRPRQGALIVREGEILTAIQEVMAASQALIAPRHG
jgi:hypothetical protein